MTNPPYSTLPSEGDNSDALSRLALDLSWSWNHSADEIWKRLDPELWEITANPWLILQSMSPRKLDGSEARVSDGCRVSTAHRTIAGQVEREECGSGLVPDSAPIVPAAHRSLLQHGIHVERGAAHLLRGPWERRRRSVESRKRLGRTRGCRRAPLSTGVLPSGARRPRRPAGSLSSERTRTVTHSQGTHSRRRVAQNGVDLTRGQDLDSYVGGAGRTNQAVPAGYQRSRQSAECQSCYQRVVRRRVRTAPAAGDAARNRRVASFCARLASRQMCAT